MSEALEITQPCLDEVPGMDAETTGAPEQSGSRAPKIADATSPWVAPVAAAIYYGIHLACLLAFVTGVSTTDVVLCVSLFYIRLFAITAGYHRYFAHRAFKTSRGFQLVLATLGCMSVQKGPLWWAAGHRRHHRYSDREGDLHSPQDGFFYSHQGWIFDGRWNATELERIPDFACVPELTWLNRWHAVPPVGLALLCFLIGGWSGLVWGFVISTTLLWHSTYTINSLAHRWGSRRYQTGDTSRNNWVLALLTLGEGWHNNHHKFMASARQGFFWWEVDVTWYLLLGLQRLGIVWDMKAPPARLLEPSAFDA